MKNRTGEKIKLASIDELLGVVNEESAMVLFVILYTPHTPNFKQIKRRYSIN